METIKRQTDWLVIGQPVDESLTYGLQALLQLGL